MAVGFSGASGDTLTRSSNLFSLANFTVCLFARVGSTSGYITPLGMWGSSETLLQIESGSPEVYAGGVVCNSANTYSLNDWLFLAMRGDGTDNSGDEWALFDGLANAASALTKTNGSRSSSFTPTTFRVGQSNYGEEMNGALVGLKVWTASLTDAEVELERRQLAPVRTANLWGFFPLLNTTDKLKDFGGNGYDLTNGTGPWTEEANPPVRWRSGHRKPVYVSAGGGATEYSRTTSLGAVIQSEQAKTASLSAVLQASDSRTASLSALIQAEGLLASSLSALIQAELQRTASLNAVVQAALEKTTSISAVLQVAQALSTGASAVIQSEEVRTSALSAIVQAALSGTANLSAVVQAELSQATSLDAIITATGSGLLTASLSALIQAEGLRSASLSAVVQAAISATASLSAVVQAEGSRASNLSAVVQAEGQRGASLSGVVQAEGAVSSSLSAVLRAALALSASLDAVVVLGGGGGALSASLSAVIADALLARWRCDEVAPERGRIVQWRCDSDAGAVMADEEGLASLTLSPDVVAFGPGGEGHAGLDFYQPTGVGAPAVAYASGAAPEALCAAFRASFTVALWLQWYTGGTDGGVVLDVHSGAADTPTSEAQNRVFQLGVASQRPYVAWRYGPSSTLVTRWFAYVLPEDEWVHLAVRMDGGTLALFVNGALAETFTAVPAATGGTEAMEVNVGAQRLVSTGWSSQVNAAVDEFCIYSRALTDAEVLRLDSMLDRMLDDVGQHHLEQVVTGNRFEAAQGKLGAARRFEGATSALETTEFAVTLGAQAESSLEGELTWCAWLKPAPDALWNKVFVLGTGGMAGRRVGLFLYSAGAANDQWRLNCGVGLLDIDVYHPASAGWRHVAAVLRRTGALYETALYFDGVRVAVSSPGALPANAPERLELGEASVEPEGAYYWGFEGWLDDVRLYARALTDAELAVIARGGAGVRKVNALNAGASSAAVESGGRGATITDDGRRNWRDDG